MAEAKGNQRKNFFSSENLTTNCDGAARLSVLSTIYPPTTPTSRMQPRVSLVSQRLLFSSFSKTHKPVELQFSRSLDEELNEFGGDEEDGVREEQRDIEDADISHSDGEVSSLTVQMSSRSVSPMQFDESAQGESSADLSRKCTFYRRLMGRRRRRVERRISLPSKKRIVKATKVLLNVVERPQVSGAKSQLDIVSLERSIFGHRPRRGSLDELKTKDEQQHHSRVDANHYQSDMTTSTGRKNAKISSESRRRQAKPAPISSDATTSGNIGGGGGAALRGSRRSTTPASSARSTSSPQPKGTVSVMLRRANGAQLGLGIAGGADRAFPPVISFLRPGFIAHRCDQLQVGERLAAVNGIRVAGLSHEQILTVLRSSGNAVQLDVEYDLNDPCFMRPVNTMNKCTEITLEKEGGSFGITLRGGAYGPDPGKSRPITVTAIRPGGPAHREGRLRIGDRIISINGIDVYSATLAVAQKLLNETLECVCLTVEYDVSVLETVRKAQGPLLLEIDKNPGIDLGAALTIRNLNGDSGGRTRSIFVENVIPASVADRCGAVHAGDELLSIDGIGLEYTTLAEARKLLRSEAGTVRLELVPHSQMKRRSKEKRTQHSSVEPRLTQPSPAWSRQMSPTSRVSGSASPTLEDLTRGGRRRASQQRAKSHDRALFSSGQPSGNGLSAVRPLRGDFASPTRRTHTSVMSGSVPNMTMYTRTSGGGAASGAGQPMTDAMARSFYENQQKFAFAPAWNQNGSLSASLSGVPCGQVCHSESMEVVLNSFSKGAFGLILHRQQTPCSFPEGTAAPLFISYIERGSPAEKCGVLQVGDRVIAINDWLTSNGTVEEANHLLRHSTSPLTLTVEFDVIESVLPTSGVFAVKLAKRGNNLGIVARSETDGMKGEPVVIADIRTGSVAHRYQKTSLTCMDDFRCGSIQPGDQLIAIDNIPLDSCTVEEAMRLLQRSADIVKLRVKKGSSFVQDDCDTAQTVVYSIELNRRRQPLGITIASSGERGDPVIISQLAPGGLAERTGALHVGDRILAINGESIEGRKVGEAMKILQQSPDIVTLKVSRVLDPPPTPSAGGVFGGFGYHHAPHVNVRTFHHNRTLTTIASDSMSDSSDKIGTPVQSIDSAVESLEDSPEQRLSGGSGTTHGINMGSARNSAENPTANGKYVEDLSARLNKTMKDWNMSSQTNGVIHHRQAVAGPSIAQKPLNQPLIANTNTGTHLPPEPMSTTSSGGADQAGWDSGLSSTTDNGIPNDVCACSCQNPRNSNNEDWVKILEALETVGEAEMLKKLEESIMGGTVPMCNHSATTSNTVNNNCVGNKASICRPAGSVFTNNNSLVGKAHHSNMPNFIVSSNNTILKHPPLASSSAIQLPNPLNRGVRMTDTSTDSISLNSSDSITGGCSDLPPSMPPPKPPRFDGLDSQRLSALFRQLSANDANIPFMTSPIPPEKVMVIQTKLVMVSALTTLQTTRFFDSDGTTTSSSSVGSFLLHELASRGSNDAHRRGSTHRVSLQKDALTKDFGFSVSDGAADCAGVFINTIRPGGPADRSGHVKPFDRILQVNDTSLEFLNCDLAVPLLMQAADRIDLMLYRDPMLRSIMEEDEGASMISSINLTLKDSAV